MLKTTTNFNTYNTATNAKPVWVVKFSFSDTYFASGTFADIGDYTVKKNLVELTDIGMSVDMLSFHTNFGGYDFSILDIDSDVRNILDNDIINDAITVYVGYQEIDLDDFIQMPTAKIKNFGLKDDFVTYWFQSRVDLLPTKSIFKTLGKTYLTSNVLDETLGEHLTDGDFSASTYWTRGGDFAISSNTLVYTHNTGSGYIYQEKKDLTIEGRPNYLYKFEYDITALSGNPSLQLSSYFANAVTDIPILSVANNNVVYFLSNENPTNFMLAATSAIGESFTLDNISLTIPETNFYVDDTTDFQTAGSPDWDAYGSNATYILVGNEIMAYTGTTATTFTVTRGALGTRAQEHKKNDEVFEIIYVNDENPGSGVSECFTFLANVLTTTNLGTNGDYDIGIADWGLGIDADLFDWNDILNQFQKYSDNTAAHKIINYFLIVVKEGIDDGLKWVEENILKSLPAYFYLTRNGLISVRFWDVYGNKDGIVTLTEDNITEISVDLNKDKIITQKEKIAGYGDIKRTYIVKNTTAFNKWGDLTYYKHSQDYYDIGGAVPPYESNLTDRIMLKFGGSNVYVKFKTFLDYQKLQIGDVIDITHTKLPVFTDGALGWTREAFEIINKRVDYRADTIEPEFEAINCLLNEKIDVVDITVYEQSEMDDDTATRNADHDEATLQVADAYIDISETSVSSVMVEITLTEPAHVGGGNEYVEFYIKIQDPANNDVKEVQKFMWYNEAGSDEVKAEFYVLDVDDDVSRVRVDFVDFSGSMFQEPTFKLTKVKIIKNNYSVSTSTV